MRRALVSWRGPFLFLFATALFVSLFLSPNVSRATGQQPEPPYLTHLLEQAIAGSLASEREWHLLLHYRANLFEGYTSEQDDDGFFLAPTGKTDPQAELEATLRQFFLPDLVGRSKQPAQCAFIARYHWLKEKLAFDDQQLEPQRCERFEQWIAELNPDSITLIFASAFMNNPASSFGHTFLRIDQKGQTEQTRILAYTINFAAEVPPHSGWTYPIKGIFGGFKGYFMTPPYYLKVQEYRDIDNRDIWEYRLGFSAAQVHRLLEHGWEMGNAYFDYFFFKENCSYHILSLLEYADPSLHLTDQFHLWTIPADTVRVVAAEPGLVQDVAFRPSRSTMIRRKREYMTPTERRLSARVAGDVTVARSEDFRQMPPSRQALMLDVASDYLRYQIDSSKGDISEEKERNRNVLAARSQLRIPSESLVIRPYAERPDIGHDTSRVSLGGGWRNNDIFEEVTARAGYHDLLDPQIGYTPDAQIEVAAVTLRHYERADQTRIERATLINVVSLSPMDQLFHAPSWKVNIGMQTIRHNDCQLCSNAVGNVGVGAATESRLLGRTVYFAFAEAEANYSRAYEERHRIGGGGTLGMYTDLTDRWRTMVSGSYLRYALGEISDDVRWFVGSRYTLSKDWAVRLEYNHRDHDDDVVVTIQAFF